MTGEESMVRIEVGGSPTEAQTAAIRQAVMNLLAEERIERQRDRELSAWQTAEVVDLEDDLVNSWDRLSGQ
jgi:hypothetical protein